MRIKKWLLTSARQLVDPDRDQTVAGWRDALVAEISRQRSAFIIADFAAAHGMDSFDIEEATRAAYQIFLNRAWSDGQLTQAETKALNQVAVLLQIPTNVQRQKDFTKALEIFRNAFADIISDGVITVQESDYLHHIAAAAGTSVRQLLLDNFLNESVHAFRYLFNDLVSKGGEIQPGWHRLIESVARLGISAGDFQNAVTPQIQRYSESLLLDAKADGVITAAEDDMLNFAIQLLGASSSTARYIKQEIDRLRLLNSVSNGHLPTIRVAESGLRAGEIPHLAENCIFSRLRMRRGTPTAETHEGRFILTDYRTLFVSPTQTVDLNHRKVINVRHISGGVEVESSGRGSGAYYFHDPELAFLIYRTALGRANQTIVAPATGSDSRHIPRDVRQRVWQRCGGKCVECSSEQYLEFDHIIPHSRGGSNHDGNIQLLCRRCNGLKSDDI